VTAPTQDQGAQAALLAAGVTAAAGTSVLAIAEMARTAQITLRARMYEDVIRLWPALDKARLPETFPGWVSAMAALTRDYHHQSAQTAGVFYEASRARALLPVVHPGTVTAVLPTPAVVQLPPAPADEWMRRAYGFSGPGMLQKDTVQPGTALSTTLGTAGRITAEGGRLTVIETVAQDPKAVGWYRVTDGKPCAFCAMLASRGIVYKKHSFDGSNDRFVGDGEFKAHNHCACISMPAFSRSQALPESTQTAQRIYAESTGDATGAGKLAAFRKAWAAHQKTLNP
jgi:hypothetical protein